MANSGIGGASSAHIFQKTSAGNITFHLQSDCFVLFMTFYINRAEGACRAQVFAGTATDAACLVDRGDIDRVFVVGIERHHLDGTCRAVTFAVAAIHVVGHADAVVLQPHGMTNLRARLLGTVDGTDSPCRADVAAARARGIAVAVCEIEARLEDAAEAVFEIRGADDALRAARDTEVAGRAELRK